MSNFYKKTGLALLIASSLLLSACNDDNSSGTKTGQVENPVKYATYISEAKYVDQQNKPRDTLENAVDISVMRYTMPNVLGKNSEATAVVMYPKTVTPSDGWRVVVWEHGTLGVGDACAPSNTELGVRFKPLADELLALGYVVIAVDYEGLGTPGIHPYLHLESEANSAIYAVKAFKEKYGARVKGEWMSVGQSQGGQASLGTAEYAYNDPTYKGAVAGAPASSLGHIITEVAPGALTNIEKSEILANIPLEKRASIQAYATLLGYGALAGAGIKAYEPNFNYLAMFEPESQETAKLAAGTNGEDGKCLAEIVSAYQDDILNFMRADSTRKVMDFPGISTNELAKNPIIQNFMNVLSQPGLNPVNKPILIIQGTADTSVPFPVTEGLFNRLKAANPATSITFLPVVGATHTQAIVQKQPELVKFIQEHMSSGLK
ncbi:alpha/beta hydrolase family protein [Acinetobacter sp. ANC 4558]|uniref:alpha/beta hydrolase family protein n=1 Tax=Acinetobacter sp. ANC 4558 TaxID=1977876 RepID=UPI001D1778A0|nr:alpha/beta hydrolase [Acinetobacter sp. ANC 4558]